MGGKTISGGAAEMYTIAMCDDESGELDKIEEMLAAYQEFREEGEAFAYRVERFDSGEALLHQMKEEDFLPDFLIMDIYMKGETGITTVRKMREDGFHLPVVFLTSSMEFALDAYEVDAIQYLVKPLEQERFYHVMDIVCKTLQSKQEEYIMVKAVGGIRKIQVEQIIYCETQKNYQILHLKTEECRIRMTSGEMHGYLEKFGQFIKCGSSYIINAEHIVTLAREEIHMDDGSRVYIPKKRAKEIKERYFNYCFGDVGE